MAEDTSPTSSEAESILAQERAHLASVYSQLERMRDETTAFLEESHENARQDLIDLSEEVRLNFGSADETMETLAAIETLNLVIDTYNNYHDFRVEQLAHILVLLESAYFAKVTLKMRPGRPARDVYIGTVGITDSEARPLVVDWRSPIAETYYNQEFGRTSYEVDGNIRTVELICRRQFDIVRNKLRSYFDTTIAIEDALLLDALRRHHSEYLKAITATIQREQNAIIRHEDCGVLLVSGIAGSGKTSVMLQRIAYLLYRQRENLDAQRIWLFTPSPVFGSYISQVLPQLGEANPHTGTWGHFMRQLGLGERSDGATGDPARLEALSAAVKDLTLESGDFRSITLENVVLLRASQAQSAWDAFNQFPAGARHTALATDRLHDSLERKLGRMSREERWQDEMLAADVDVQAEVFGYVVDPVDSEETIELTRRYLDWRFSSAHTLIDTLEWLRIDRIGCRLLDTPGLTAAEYLWLRLLISGHGERDGRYVVIDEVQDYTRTQLMVLARYFERAHFLLLGDPNQAIREDTASWDEIREIFAEAAKRARGSQDFVEARLLTSYRSSPEITALFASLLPPKEASQLVSVQEAGRQALICEAGDTYLDTLHEAVGHANEREGLTAIICADRSRARWLAKQLNGQVRLIGRHDTLPATGTLVLDLALAKGLEFDCVIIPDAQAEVYPDTALARRCLYTAISRATHEVEIYSQGPLTPLLTATTK